MIRYDLVGLCRPSLIYLFILQIDQLPRSSLYCLLRAQDKTDRNYNFLGVRFCDYGKNDGDFTSKHQENEYVNGSLA